MSENLLSKKIIQNNSTDNAFLSIDVDKYKNVNYNSKLNGYQKNIIEKNKNKNLCLTKYINKYNNKDKNNHYNNLVIKKYNNIKDNSKNIYNYKNKNHINNIYNIKLKYDYNYYFGDQIRKRTFDDDNNQKYEIYNKTYNNNYNFGTYKCTNSSFDRKISKYFYYFPDNKFIRVKGLSRDKIFYRFKKKGNKKIFGYTNRKGSPYFNKEILYNSKLFNYFTDLSTYLYKNNEFKSLSTERSRLNYLNLSKDKEKHIIPIYNNFVRQLILFIIKVEKYIKLKTRLKYGNILFHYLNVMYRTQKEYLKKQTLLCLVTKRNKMEKKYYFNKLRNITIKRKNNIIYINNDFDKNENSYAKNYKLRKKNTKKVNNLKNKKKKAKLFITKTPNKTNNNKTILLNQTKKKNVEKFVENIHLIIYKNNIKKYYLPIKKRLISNYKTIKSSKIISNSVDKKIKRIKKHVKVKFIRKASGPNMIRNEFSLSIKTNSSDISKSTIHSTKKMKVYNRIVYINNPNNLNENILEMKMNNRILKMSKNEEKDYFYKWKKVTFNNNNKRKNNFIKSFLLYFMANYIYYKEKIKQKINFNILLGYSMYIWKRKTFD